MALSAVSSLVTIISIYREGGILKRLRATPLSPTVILSAHVIVKLLFTILTLFIMVLAGRRYIPPGADVPLVWYGIALTFTTWAILSIGFLIASIVPTARFAQPLAALILYPMVALSGLFFPIADLPQPVKSDRACLAARLRGVAAGWHLEGRGMVVASRRRRRAHALLPDLLCYFEPSVSLGIARSAPGL